MMLHEEYLSAMMIIEQQMKEMAELDEEIRAQNEQHEKDQKHINDTNRYNTLNHRYLTDDLAALQ